MTLERFAGALLHSLYYDGDNNNNNNNIQSRMPVYPVISVIVLSHEAHLV